ncbi:MAG: amidohydrolase family protein [Paracoccaceae bacterium]
MVSSGPLQFLIITYSLSSKGIGGLLRGGRMIDAHQHFWSLSRGDYSWPNDSVEPIFRDFCPDDLSPLLQRAGVSRTILVQATDTVAETEWLLELPRTFPAVAGVVGWVDLSAPDAIVMIDRLRADPLLKGLRPMLQNIQETDWILRPEVAPSLAHMERVGLRFDALIQPRHLPSILALAGRYPDLPIVIDHLAKPRMGAGITPDDAWANGMRTLAARPNVWCKLSGMITEIGPGWQPEDLAPFAALVLDAFGPSRCMFGSDWPVVTLAGSYQGWMDMAQTLTARFSAAEKERVFATSAAEFYGLEK